MTTWDPDILDAIASSDDLHISPFREDGVTYGTPTWIWSVVSDGHLYVRAWNGTRGRWYRAAVAQRAGRIRAAGRVHEVSFVLADDAVAGSVDAAYAAKYAGSPYLPPMLGAGPREATIEIRPHA